MKDEDVELAHALRVVADKHVDDCWQALSDLFTVFGLGCDELYLLEQTF